MQHLYNLGPPLHVQKPLRVFIIMVTIVTITIIITITIITIITSIIITIIITILSSGGDHAAAE